MPEVLSDLTVFETVALPLGDASVLDRWLQGKGSNLGYEGQNLAACQLADPGVLERVRGLEPRLRVWKTPVLAPTPYPPRDCHAPTAFLSDTGCNMRRPHSIF